MRNMLASHQWATRPADERFVNLLAMREHFSSMRQNSAQRVVSTRAISMEPNPDNKGIALVHRDAPNYQFEPTHWAFGQLASLAKAPAGYLRTLPSPLVADCVNYGLKFQRDIEDVGLLLYKNGGMYVQAATGPRYGRIWNSEIVDILVDKFGDGVSGEWRVPGEFRQRVEVNQQNTTLYAGDRDMFVFLANEENMIELPNRRDGQPGSMARGFYVWNSQVGSAVFGFATFLYDYVCCNRIVWGMDQYNEVRIRHTASAPDKWMEEVQPALKTYANGSASSVVKLIEAARDKRIEDVDEFLAKRFGKGQVESIKSIHELEEGRPIENLWDAVTAVTAQARSIKWQDERVDLERKGGELLKLAN